MIVSSFSYLLGIKLGFEIEWVECIICMNDVFIIGYLVDVGNKIIYCVVVYFSVFCVLRRF